MNSSEPGEPSRALRFVTIGVYGFSEAGFFHALEQAGVTTFCDIRWRRGVRGSEYAFVNSARLQRRLNLMGIRYLHFRELAPSPALRELQAQADKAERKAKRQRVALSEGFVKGYGRERLLSFDSRKFVEQLGLQPGAVALFCVEGNPAACHRSLLAERLGKDLNVDIRHLLPS